jgi:hypothetical protein
VLSIYRSNFQPWSQQLYVTADLKIRIISRAPSKQESYKRSYCSVHRCSPFVSIVAPPATILYALEDSLPLRSPATVRFFPRFEAMCGSAALPSDTLQVSRRPITLPLGRICFLAAASQPSSSSQAQHSTTPATLDPLAFPLRTP